MATNQSLDRTVKRPHRVNVRLTRDEAQRARAIVQAHAVIGIQLSIADALRLALSSYREEP